jgi:hypothetical protein
VPGIQHPRHRGGLSEQACELTICCRAAVTCSGDNDAIGFVCLLQTSRCNEGLKVLDLLAVNSPDPSSSKTLQLLGG